jgi:hypothetical protein
MTVYELKIDWATNDAQDCATTLYSTEEKARVYFVQEVEQAKEDYYHAFDEDGNLEDGWVIEERKDYWEIYAEGFYVSEHCTITLTKKEVW